ncbi:MAG TPA: hypothetical protein VGD72_01595 [Mycobacteriales bacterium]
MAMTAGEVGALTAVHPEPLDLLTSAERLPAATGYQVVSCPVHGGGAR